MDYLWTPWRYQYMADAAGKAAGVYFLRCGGAEPGRGDADRAPREEMFVILNRYPYTSGHVMIVPYAHVAELGLCEPGTLDEMMALAQRMETIFRANY